MVIQLKTFSRGQQVVDLVKHPSLYIKTWFKAQAISGEHLGMRGKWNLTSSDVMSFLRLSSCVSRLKRKVAVSSSGVLQVLSPNNPHRAREFFSKDVLKYIFYQCFNCRRVIFH